MNLDWIIFKTKFLMKLDRITSKVKAKYKAKKLWFLICIRFPKQERDRVLERYLIMYNYRRKKQESLNRLVSYEIATVSDKSGIPQYVLRDIADRILKTGVKNENVL